MRFAIADYQKESEVHPFETPINANNIHRDNQGRFCCQYQLFTPGLQFQTT